MAAWIPFFNHSRFHSLRNIFKPLYILLSILGLFPYSVKFHSISNDYHFLVISKSIYINFVITLAYLLTILSFLAMHIRYIYFSIEVDTLTEGIMTQLNYITELFNLTIFCIITYMCTFINRFKYIKILNILASRIDPPNNNSEKVLRNLHFQINVIGLGTIALTFLMQACVNFTRKDSNWKMILVVFTFNLPQMIQFTYLTFFYVLMMMSVEILKNITEQTSVLAKETIYPGGITKVHTKKRVLSLRQMEIIYMDISSVVKTVNNIFEAPILVTMMQSFHSIVSESHIIYHGVVVEKNLELHEIVNCSVWILYQFLKVYTVARSGKLFKVEQVKLGQAIHKIPTERQDLRFMMEVQHFSSMMSFQTCELTVYGYFPLDATLTFKVVAAAAMYIIILVQFDKAFPQLD